MHNHKLMRPRGAIMLGIELDITDEDLEIRTGLAYIGHGAGRGVHAYFRNRQAEDRDAAIMARLASTRRNNRSARGNAEGLVP